MRVLRAALAVIVGVAMSGALVLAQPSKRGTVRVVNDTPVAVKLKIGEQELGTIVAGGRQDFPDVEKGTRLLSAETEAMDRHWGPHEVLVGPDVVEWRLSATETTGVKISNWTKNDLLVKIGDLPAGKALANGSCVFYELRVGPTKFSAETVNKTLAYSPRFIDVKAGEMQEWTIGTKPKEAPASQPGS